MHPSQELSPIRQLQRSVSDFLIPAPQPISINESVGQKHYVLVHSVLMCKIDYGVRMRAGETAEEGDVKATFASSEVSHLEQKCY
jgi:hypothetical protein